MSLQLVRPYFRTNLVALGFTEWLDAFNVENIPSSKLDKAFHIESGQVAIQSNNQTDVTAQHQVIISVWRKGYRTSAQAIEQLGADADAIIARVLAPTRRLTSGIKNVQLRQIATESMASTNDNVAVMRMTFDCLLIFNP